MLIILTYKVVTFEKTFPAPYCIFNSNVIQSYFLDFPNKELNYQFDYLTTAIDQNMNFKFQNGECEPTCRSVFDSLYIFPTLSPFHALGPNFGYKPKAKVVTHSNLKHFNPMTINCIFTLK